MGAPPPSSRLFTVTVEILPLERLKSAQRDDLWADVTDALNRHGEQVGSGKTSPLLWQRFPEEPEPQRGYTVIVGTGKEGDDFPTRYKKLRAQLTAKLADVHKLAVDEWTQVKYSRGGDEPVSLEDLFGRTAPLRAAARPTAKSKYSVRPTRNASKKGKNKQKKKNKKK